jgi:hypothetical protein
MFISPVVVTGVGSMGVKHGWRYGAGQGGVFKREAYFVQCDKDVAGMEGGEGIIKELGGW